MDFLGIGPLELVFILIIALIIFGPNDVVRAGRTLGSFLRKVVTSDGWRAFQQASKGMRDLPNALMREAGLEEENLRELTGVKDLEQATKGIEKQIAPWTTPPATRPNKPVNPEESPIPEEKDLPETGTPSSQGETETTPKEFPAPLSGSPFSESIDEEH